MPKVDRLFSLLLTIFDLLLDALRFIRLSLQPRCNLAAENLFLRKQLALYLERQVEPRRPAKLTLVLLSRLFSWRQDLTIVKPDTFVRWHRQGFRLFWKWKSRSRGRPRIPAELQNLIVTMANDNPAWGEERIAAELLLKVGIRISPRTVRRHMPKDRGPQRGPSSQHWMTFVRNHAKGILACDLLRDRNSQLSGAVRVCGHGGGHAQDRSRQRVPFDQFLRYLLRDRDRIFGDDFREQMRDMGICEVLSAPRSPWQRAFVERVIGSIRRELCTAIIAYAV